MAELDTKTMSVEQIRDMLVEAGLSREEVEAIKGKSILTARLNELIDDEATLEGAIAEDLDEVPQDKEIIDEEIQMTPQNPGWTDYVLSLMRPDELVDGHPKVDGLRRIVEQLMGTVLAVKTQVHQTPCPDNNWHATVLVTVILQDQEIDAAADAGGNNTPPVFAKHPVATAESRAEGRAYRKLLRLSNVISAEESVKDSEIIDMGDLVQEHQLNYLDSFAKKVNINVPAWLLKKGIDATKIEKISRSKAAELLAEMNSFIAQKDSVSDDIKGYLDWRVL